MVVKQNIFKIVVAGDGGVGKTTLLEKFVTGSFALNTHMTIGVQFHMKQLTIDGQPYSLQLWDLGGQDRFRFMLPSYTLGATGALFLYDMTRMTSLESIEEWIKICRTHNKNLPILMCGAKADLTAERSVTPEYAATFLQTYSFFNHIEVSSKTGLNVELTFEIITKKILEEMAKSRTTLLSPPPP